MIQKDILRSALQLAGLCLAAAILSSTPVAAADECTTECSDWSCTERADDCASQCGATVTWEYQYTNDHHWFHDDPWLPHWHTDHHAVFNYDYDSGIESFECDQESQTSLCTCAY